MMPWQRAPREVYRVYGEDEYLAAEDRPTSERPHVSASDSVEEDSRVALASPASHGSGQGRLIGLGLLIGVTIGAVGLVVVNMSHRSPSREAGASRSEPARTPSPTEAARPESGDSPFGRESEAKPSARKRSRDELMLQATRRLDHDAERLTQLRTSMAPAPPLSGLASISQSEASLADDEFDFER